MVLLPAAGLADHPAQGTDTLMGVPAVTVAVEPLGARLRDNGVTREAVRQMVAAALADSGIPAEAGDPARLHVRLDLRRATRRFLALAIALELRQHARLERDPDQVISAITWTNAAVTPLAEGDYAEVPARVAELVEQTFVRDFRMANSAAE
jgi:hypothetical protein